MATETMHAASVEPPRRAAQPELLVSAVLHLMSHYSSARNDADGSKLAPVIERHLKALADLPDLAPVLRATCRQLSVQWANMVGKTKRASAKRNLFHRLIVGPRAE